MLKGFIASCLLLLLFSCKKETATPFSEAAYKITVTGQWQMPQFGVPPNVHFTYFAGMIHNSTAYLWRPGSNASPGIRNVAEYGGLTQIIQETDSIIYQKNSISHIAFPPPSATGTVSSNVYCNSNYSYVSFASMIAPSPDWFIGVSSLNLYNNNQWLKDTLINLFVYDAGTKDGDVFSMTGPATTPQEPIMLQTPARATVLANGNAILAPIATVRFMKL